MMDLADYLQAEVDKASIRRVAKHIGVSKTTVENICKRKIETMPKVKTLEKIAAAYGLTLPVVIEMAGAMLGDGDKFIDAAHELEQSPWIERRLTELTSLSEAEFNYWMDWIAWRRRHPAPPDESPDPPIQ